MTAIKDKRPVLMGIEDILDGYIKHECEVVTKRSIFDLNKAQEREHIVEGLIKAISILDEVVKTIRASKDKSDAKVNLMNAFGFTERQAEAIVTLQLYRLTNTDIVSLENEQKELQALIESLNAILNSEKVLRKVIINELNEIKKKYPTPRLTEIKDEIMDTSVNQQAMIISEDVYVSITRDGYFKKISTRSYKASDENTFGKKDTDMLVDLFEANTLDIILSFTNKGNYCFVPVYKLEDFKWKDLGKHLSYLIKLGNDEKIIGNILVKSFDLDQYVVLSSKNGQIKRVSIKDFNVSRFSKPLKCMNLKDNDELVSVDISDGTKGIITVTKAGYGTLYSEDEISVLGVKAGGVKGINMRDDEVAFMCVFDPSVVSSLLLILNPAHFKRIHISDIPACHRATKGTLLFKSLKTKPTKIFTGFISNPQDEFVVKSGTETMKIVSKDISFGALSTKANTLKQCPFDFIDDVHLTRSMIIEEHVQKKVEENKVDLTIKDPNLFDEMEGDPDTEFEFISMDDYLDEK